MHQLLRRHGVVVPYSSLHRFAVKHCPFGARGRITVRMADVPPGEVAEIDFGRLGSLGRVPPLTFLPRPDLPPKSSFDLST